MRLWNAMLFEPPCLGMTLFETTELDLALSAGIQAILKAVITVRAKRGDRICLRSTLLFWQIMCFDPETHCSRVKWPVISH
jgi:hypothetical protein